MSRSQPKPICPARLMRRTSELPERAAVATKRLERFNVVVKTLFQDENFTTLLQAESMLGLPFCLFSAAVGGKPEKL